MKHTVRKTLLLSPALVVALSAAFFGARAQNPPQTAPSASASQDGAAAPKTASQQFKNIQVLKDMPADQLIPAMQFMTASLGVDCEYCHVEKAFDKDDKKTKGYARHMMEMMFNNNKENFDNQRWVTCYSCHQGSPHPPSIPAISAKARAPVMMAGGGKTAARTG